MGRFGHFLLGFLAGAIAFRYLTADTLDGFWLIAFASVCFAAELLYAFRVFDKRIVSRLLTSRPQNVTMKAE